ncbi:hypothetical protein D3C76_1616680 [compost metagenome]
MLVQSPQAGRVDDKGADRRRNPPQGNVQRLGLNAPGLQHKVMHEDNRPEGDKDVFAEEQPDVVRRRRHRPQAIADRTRQLTVFFLCRTFRHRGQ